MRDAWCSSKEKPATIAAGSKMIGELGLVGGVQHSARNDLSLNFRRPFEDIEDAGIIHNSAHRIFQGKPIASMDL